MPHPSTMDINELYVHWDEIPIPVGARVDDVGLGGPLWSPAVPLMDVVTI